MTATAHRAAASKRLPVYDSDGRVIATVSQARAVSFTSLLGECDFGHCYLIPDDTKAWLAADAVCPRCRALGLAPGVHEGISHAD
jgi:hypothetical protein